MLDYSGLTQCRAPNTQGCAPNKTRRTINLGERPTYHMFGMTHTFVTNNPYGSPLKPCMYYLQITKPKRCTGLANNPRLAEQSSTGIVLNEFLPIYYTSM